MNTNPIFEAMQAHIGRYSSEGSPSALSRWLNGKLVAVEWGSLTFEFEVREDFTNPAMILHGGVAAAMMDDVIGATVFSLGKDAFFASLNLNVDYLRPAKIGETIQVISEIIRDGNTVTHAECKILNKEGKLVAKAVSNLVRTKF